MSGWRWIGALGQRVGLFLLAGLLAVSLLHAQAGYRREVTTSGPAGTRVTVIEGRFLTEPWVKAIRLNLENLARGDLGTLKALRVTGYTKDQPMAEVLRKEGANSAMLLTLALAFSLVAGSLAGLLSSRFGARWFRAPTLSATLFLLSTPDILIVLLLRVLVGAVLSAFGIQLFSLSALGGALQPSHFIAPMLALSALPLALVARISAVAFDEVYDQLYIRTAVSKGLHPVRVIWGHALKNGWIRVAEVGPVVMSALVTGLVIVEYILYFPGIGRTLGLILEKGELGQAAASVSIALALLVGALLIETTFAATRLALDPRIAERQAAGGSFSEDGGLWERLRGLPASLARWPGAVASWASEAPLRWRRRIWSWRPALIWKEIWTNPPLWIGLLGVLALAFLALFGGQFVDLGAANRIPRYVIDDGEVFFPPFRPGVPGYPLGSDMAGRDLLSRILIGARYTLFFTLAVTPVRFLIALPWGLMAGLRRGIWAAGGRTFGLMLSALPIILVPAMLLPLIRRFGTDPGMGMGFWLIAGLLALVGVPRLVETIRQNVESIAVQPFVEGARAVGAHPGRILARHILPHLVPQLWVAAAADMAWTLLLLAQLGVFGIFLGGSVFVATGMEVIGGSSGIWLPRVPDWSSMLSRPYEVIYRAPWSLWFPALAFLLSIVAFNLVAEGLRRRAQRLSAVQVPEPEEVTPPLRRRVALEWSAALLLLAALGGLTWRYGFESLPVYQTVKAQTPLERARLQLQVALETAAGTGGSLERSKALAMLGSVGRDYLFQASAAGLNAAEIQTDSRNMLTILQSGGHLLANAYIPDTPTGNNSFLFFRDDDDNVSYAQSVERPTSFAFVPDGDGRGTLLVAGTVPGRDHWVLTVWRGPFSSFPNGMVWRAEPALADAIAKRVEPEFQLKAVEGAGVYRIEQTISPTANIKVAANGDISFCKAINQDCVTIPWAEVRR